MKAIILAAALLSSASFGYAAEMQGGDKHMHGVQAQAATGADKNQATHKLTGVVKKADTSNGKVTLAHEAVKTLNWPAMTMTFVVKDKSILAKMPEGKKVEADFQQQGRDYVITSVK